MTLNSAERICELGRAFYHLGWISGTGGGISIRENDKIYIAPSGVQKERLQPEDIFQVDLEGRVIKRPENEQLRISECTPLFMNAYQLRNAGAVIHSHSLNAVLTTIIYQNFFHISGIEMQKGIKGYRMSETLEIPIIENTEREAELTDSMANAIRAHHKTQAVLVRRHGVYVWGDSWQEAKTQAECYDYLFKAAVEIKRLGIGEI